MFPWMVCASSRLPVYSGVLRVCSILGPLLIYINYIPEAIKYSLLFFFTDRD